MFLPLTPSPHLKRSFWGQGLCLNQIASIAGKTPTPGQISTFFWLHNRKDIVVFILTFEENADWSRRATYSEGNCKWWMEPFNVRELQPKYSILNHYVIQEPLSFTENYLIPNSFDTLRQSKILQTMEIFVNKPIAYTIILSYSLIFPQFSLYHIFWCTAPAFVSHLFTVYECAIQNYCKVKSHILQKSQVSMTSTKMILEKPFKTYTDPWKWECSIELD